MANAPQNGHGNRNNITLEIAQPMGGMNGAGAVFVSPTEDLAFDLVGGISTDKANVETTGGSTGASITGSSHTQGRV